MNEFQWQRPLAGGTASPHSKHQNAEIKIAQSAKRGKLWVELFMTGRTGGGEEISVIFSSRRKLVNRKATSTRANIDEKAFQDKLAPIKR